VLITSLDNDRIKNYIKLKERKHRKESKTFIIEGMHLVMEAIKKGIVIELILEKDTALPLRLPTTYVTKEIIEKISSLETPSNIMALCNMLSEEEDLGSKILLLDEIQDPGNLGTIIRSSVAFNIDTLIISPDTVDIYNPKVLRATQGMLFHLNIVVRDLHDAIMEIKKREIPVYGTRLEIGEDVRKFPEKDKARYALVLGNEGSGVDENILNMCDKYLYIAMNENAESLNVAVASSIILYELNR